MGGHANILFRIYTSFPVFSKERMKVHVLVRIKRLNQNVFVDVHVNAFAFTLILMGHMLSETEPGERYAQGPPQG